ncbi:MAG: dehydratase [Alphaproteobacteria bacterium]|nr:dehydratase [Alphaproteobacteria bacterium]
MRQFDDLVIGEKSISDPMHVDRVEMIAFATKYDPQWFHADSAKAESSVFGEVVASGIYTAALWRRMDHTINGDVDFICGVAWEEARWPKAVRAGDTLRATSEILEKRESRNDPSRGIAIFRYGVINQHGEEVFSCRSVNLVRRHLGVD